MLHFLALTYIYVLRVPLLGLSGLTLRELWFLLVFLLSMKTTIFLIEMSDQIMPQTPATYSKYVQSTMSNHDRFQIELWNDEDLKRFYFRLLKTNGSRVCV